jgi:DNA-binding response OmpR family regulator
MKILICEDNRLALKTISVVLEREGYSTDIAENGNTALEKLSNTNYELVLIDIHLPFHSGLEIITYLRSELKKKTPVIILTAFSDPQMQKQARELGINEYMLKPFNPADLIERIRSLLKN